MAHMIWGFVKMNPAVVVYMAGLMACLKVDGHGQIEPGFKIYK